MLTVQVKRPMIKTLLLLNKLSTLQSLQIGILSQEGQLDTRTKEKKETKLLLDMLIDEE